MSYEEKLIEEYANKDRPFQEYITAVADSLYPFQSNLESAALLLRTTPAELAAINALSIQDEGVLGIIEGYPPKTTWFLFANCDENECGIMMESLKNTEGVSSYMAAKRALEEARGPDTLERISQLDGETLMHFSVLATEYGAMNPKMRAALHDIGKRKARGVDLTVKQLTYVAGMLKQLHEANVISERSANSDQEKCDKVLWALGVN